MLKHVLILLCLLFVGCGVQPKLSNNSQSSPNSEYCSAKYSSLTTESICRSYHSNSELTCDHKMRSILGERNVIVGNITTCGSSVVQSMPSNQDIKSNDINNSQNCPYTFSGNSTQDICNQLWSSSNTVCASKHRDELIRRGINWTPQNNCGTPINNKSTRQTSAVQNSDANELCKLSHKQSKTQGLCQALWSNNSACKDFISTEIKSRDKLSEPKELCGYSNLALPSNLSSICKATFNNFLRQENPVKAACIFRYASLEKETIICRSSILDFINLHSNGVGNNLNTCGQ